MAEFQRWKNMGLASDLRTRFALFKTRSVHAGLCQVGVDARSAAAAGLRESSVTSELRQGA